MILKASYYLNSSLDKPEFRRNGIKILNWLGYSTTRTNQILLSLNLEE